MSPSRELLIAISKLTVYGRAYCHLCDDMLAALERLRGEFSFAVAWVDLDKHPELEERHGERIPVLEADGVEVCHFFLDEGKLREVLGRFR